MSEKNCYLPATISVHKFSNTGGHSPTCGGCGHCDCLPKNTTIYGYGIIVMTKSFYCENCYNKLPDYIQSMYKENVKIKQHNEIVEYACDGCEKTNKSVCGKKYYSLSYSKELVCNNCSENYYNRFFHSKCENIEFNRNRICCYKCHRNIKPRYLTNEDGYIYLSSCDNLNYKKNLFLSENNNISYDKRNKHLYNDISEMSMTMSSYSFRNTYYHNKSYDNIPETVQTKVNNNVKPVEEEKKMDKEVDEDGFTLVKYGKRRK